MSSIKIFKAIVFLLGTRRANNAWKKKRFCRIFVLCTFREEKKRTDSFFLALDTIFIQNIVAQIPGLQCSVSFCISDCGGRALYKFQWCI